MAPTDIPYTCLACGQTYLGEQNFGEHPCGEYLESVDMAPEDISYTCLACGQTYLGAQNFGEHLCEDYVESADMAPGDISYTCLACGQTYLGEQNFDEHPCGEYLEAADMAPGGISYTCLACGQTYLGEQNFGDHPCEDYPESADTEGVSAADPGLDILSPFNCLRISESSSSIDNQSAPTSLYTPSSGNSIYTPAPSSVFTGDDNSTCRGADTPDYSDDGSEQSEGDESTIETEGGYRESYGDDEEYVPSDGARTPRQDRDISAGHGYLNPNPDAPNTILSAPPNTSLYWHPQPGFMPQHSRYATDLGPAYYTQAPVQPSYTPAGFSHNRAGGTYPYATPTALHQPSPASGSSTRYIPPYADPSQHQPLLETNPFTSTTTVPQQIPVPYTGRAPFVEQKPTKRGYVRHADKGPRPASKKYPRRPQKQKVFYPVDVLGSSSFRSTTGTLEVHEVAREAGNGRGKKESRPCPLCGKSFATEHRLKDHLESSVHSEQAVNWGGGRTKKGKRKGGN